MSNARVFAAQDTQVVDRMEGQMDGQAYIITIHKSINCSSGLEKMFAVLSLKHNHNKQIK